MSFIHHVQLPAKEWFIIIISIISERVWQASFVTAPAVGRSVAELNRGTKRLLWRSLRQCGCRNVWGSGNHQHPHRVTSHRVTSHSPHGLSADGIRAALTRWHNRWRPLQTFVGVWTLILWLKYRGSVASLSVTIPTKKKQSKQSSDGGAEEVEKPTRMERLKGEGAKNEASGRRPLYLLNCTLYFHLKLKM